MWAWLLAAAVAWAGDLAQVHELADGYRPWRMAKGVPALPASAWEQVAAGQIATGVVAVDGSSVRKTWALGIIDAPVERVWGAINDESLHTQYTSLSYVELLRGRSCESGRQVLQVLPVGVPGVEDRWWITIRSTNGQLRQTSQGWVRELVWESSTDAASIVSDKGKASIEGAIPVGFTRGAWYLVGMEDGRTLVEYYAWVDPGGSLSPSLMTMFAGKTLRSTFEQMGAAARDSRVKCTGG